MRVCSEAHSSIDSKAANLCSHASICREAVTQLQGLATMPPLTDVHCSQVLVLDRERISADLLDTDRLASTEWQAGLGLTTDQRLAVLVCNCNCNSLELHGWLRHGLLLLLLSLLRLVLCAEAPVQKHSCMASSVGAMLMTATHSRLQLTIAPSACAAAIHAGFVAAAKLPERLQQLMIACVASPACTQLLCLLIIGSSCRMSLTTKAHHAQSQLQQHQLRLQQQQCMLPQAVFHNDRLSQLQLQLQAAICMQQLTDAACRHSTTHSAEYY